MQGFKTTVVASCLSMPCGRIPVRNKPVSRRHSVSNSRALGPLTADNGSNLPLAANNTLPSGIDTSHHQYIEKLENIEKMFLQAEGATTRSVSSAAALTRHDDALLTQDRSSPAATTASSDESATKPFAASRNPYRHVTRHASSVVPGRQRPAHRQGVAVAASVAPSDGHSTAGNILTLSHLQHGKQLTSPSFSSGAVTHGVTLAPPVAPATFPSPPELYNKIVDIGTGKTTLPVWKTIAMGVLAGSYTAFGATLALTVGGNLPGFAATNPGLQKMILGLVGLPFGAMMALVCGAELFTANLALTSTALYEGRVSTRQIATSWASAFLGNAIGASLMVALVWGSGIFATASAPLNVAVTKTSIPVAQAFIRGILCNWLLCLAVWMGNAASDVVGKGVGVLVPISAFVTMGFEHSVANMFFIPLGIALGAPVSVGQYLLHNLLPVTLGNIFGGAVCVGAMYYAVFGSLGKAKWA